MIKFRDLTIKFPDSAELRRQSILAVAMLGSLLAVVLGFIFYGVGLFVLAFVITFGSLIFGVFLIIRSYGSGDQHSIAVASEVKALANDASFDVSEQIIVWDRLKLTKGVGTKLEGHEDSIEEVYNRLVRVHEDIDAAETQKHRLEAVLHADSVLATARSLQ